MTLHEAEMFFIFFVFYDAKIPTLSGFGALVNLYTILMQTKGKDHVGISFGTLDSYKNYVLLPFDWSCWNGRNMGSTYISKFEHNNGLTIRASAVYGIKIPKNMYDNYLNSMDTMNNNIKYPSTSTILKDFFSYIVFRINDKIRPNRIGLESPGLLRDEKEPANSLESTCSEFSIKTILSVLKKDTKVFNRVKNIHINTLNDIQHRKSALHPSILENELKRYMHVDPSQYIFLGRDCKIFLKGYPTALRIQDLCLRDPGRLVHVGTEILKLRIKGSLF